MRLRLGRPRTAIVVAPHPDDEIIAAAGLIRALVRGGARVRVIIVTDGAGSHRNSVAWPRPRLVAARYRESRLALARLGLAAGAVRFLGLPDGALDQMPVAVARALRRALRQGRRPDLLVGPAADDAHPDHRQVAAVLASCHDIRRRLAYRVWPPRPVPVARSLRLNGMGSHAAKRALIRVHRTQLGGIRDDPAGFAIAPHELAAFAHPVERYVEVRR